MYSGILDNFKFLVYIETEIINFVGRKIIKT